jgi:hypothetical protein
MRIRKAMIVGAEGVTEVSIPSKDTKDFHHSGCRYIIDQKAMKMKSVKILSILDFLFIGGMFVLLGASGAPQFYVAGFVMFMVGGLVKGTEMFFKTPFLLYFEGRSLPVTFASGEEYKLPQIVKDAKGVIKEVKMIDGYDFDSVVEGHALRDLGWKPLQNIPWKWVVIGIIALIAVAVVISFLTRSSSGPVVLTP